MQSFPSHFFLLAACFFFFFITSSLKFVTIRPELSTTAALAVNSKSVIFVKCGDLFSRYPIAEIWKLSAWRILFAMTSVLKLSKSKASVFQSSLKSKRHFLRSKLIHGFQRQLIIILFSFLIAIIWRNIVGTSLITVMTLLRNILLQRGYWSYTNLFCCCIPQAFEIHIKKLVHLLSFFMPTFT